MPHAHSGTRLPGVALLTRQESVPKIEQKIVHQQWKCNVESCLPEKMRQWRDNCKRRNPGWSFMLWNDTENRALVQAHFPWFLSTYDSYPRSISRFDSIRWVYLAVMGGIYMDIDYTCLRPLETLIAEGWVVFSASERFGPPVEGLRDRMYGVNPWARTREGAAMRSLISEPEKRRTPVGNSLITRPMLYPSSV